MSTLGCIVCRMSTFACLSRLAWLYGTRSVPLLARLPSTIIPVFPAHRHRTHLSLGRAVFDHAFSHGVRSLALAIPALTCFSADARVFLHCTQLSHLFRTKRRSRNSHYSARAQHTLKPVALLEHVDLRGGLHLYVDRVHYVVVTRVRARVPLRLEKEPPHLVHPAC